MKSNKSISRKNFFGQIPIFAISQMTKNQYLNWEKVKTAKSAISREKNYDLFDFMSFLA